MSCVCLYIVFAVLYFYSRKHDNNTHFLVCAYGLFKPNIFLLVTRDIGFLGAVFYPGVK